jgi:hypothetical protein
MQDILPEHIRYRDVGCELHDHCLTCPLPVCKEELTQGVQAVRAYMRNLQIDLLRTEGYTVEWVAQVMGISVRGVYKSVARKHELGPLTDTIRRAKMTVAAHSNGR